MKLLHLAPTLLLAAPTLAQEALWEIGGKGGAPLGQAATDLDDVDGDGSSDVALGAPAPFGGRVEVRSGADGGLLLTVPAPPGTFEFGRGLASILDVDGDGRRDLLASHTRGVEVIGSASGAVVVSVPLDPLRSEWGFGSALAGLDDLNGDGVPEVLLGGPEQLVVLMGHTWKTFIGGPGYVDVRSGADGSLLRRHVGVASGEGLGGSVASLGDVDGDGVGDYAAASRVPHSLALGGALRVYSGASGTLLHDLSGALPWIAGMALEVAPLGDADGDGRADLAVAEVAMGQVAAFSGAGGGVIWSLPPTAAKGDVLGRLASLADADGDGVRELALTAPQPSQPGNGPLGPFEIGPGFVRVLSGAAGAPLRFLLGPEPEGLFGSAAASPGDLDGDGRAELLVGAPGDHSVGRGRAVVLSLSGRVSEPTPACPGILNSVDQRAVATLEGSLSVAANALVLRVGGGVPGSTALALAAQGTGYAALGSPPVGWLCLARPIARAGAPLTLTAAGGGRWVVDLTAPELGGVVPGATWAFQVAYTDVDPLQGAVWRTSGAVLVTFMP